MTELFAAYGFLRRIEHRLQMENGLQTHTISDDAGKRLVLARRMDCKNLTEFDKTLKVHTKNVSRIFQRVFDVENSAAINAPPPKDFNQNSPPAESGWQKIYSSLKKSDVVIAADDENLETTRIISETSPHYAQMLAANPNLIKNLPSPTDEFSARDYRGIFLAAVAGQTDFKNDLAVLRKNWSRFLLEIVAFDIFGKLSRQESKRLQTRLAEASLDAALLITKRELERRYALKINEFPFAVLGLGKLGGGGMDYGSDLDLVLVYEKVLSAESEVLSQEALGTQHSALSTYHARAVEIFVTALSSLTRDGALYRVDLRLRPDGKNGAASISRTAFLNYLENRAAMWEWLAYVKLRGAAGDLILAQETESAARKIIHANAQKSDFDALKEETKRIRERLENEKSGNRNGKEIDIKFGAGGMLDVYFAVRFLQLRDDVPDDADNRSTLATLNKLLENKSLNDENYRNFSDGYEFLTELDHHLRLTVGRSSKIPLANRRALRTIVNRMKIASVKDLLEQLTFHRLNIRAAFENIIG